MRGAFVTLIVAMAVVPSALAQDCAPVPPPVVDITSNRFYSDAANSIVDPQRWEQRQRAMKPLEDFRSDMARYASRVLAGQKLWARCLESGLLAWSEGGALLGKLNEIQAHFERVWMLSGLSMSYLMAREEISPSSRKVIEIWLERLATETAKDVPARRKGANNHLYWLGFSLGAAASATGNARHWTLAAEIFRESVAHIEADGSLPKEMARAGMASHYHAFSIVPLVMHAELAARRGEDWYSQSKGALHRLAALVMLIGNEPQTLAKRAGAAQKPVPRNNFSWLAFYARRFPDRSKTQPALESSEIWYVLTGGNMSLLARRWVAGP